MRAKDCVICGAPLPEGGRIDRRYCREACRVMAYRQRRKPEPSVSASSPSAEKEGHSFDDFATAKDRIADLESQCRALRQRATTLELQHEAMQRRLAFAELAIRRLRSAAMDSASQHDAATNPSVGADEKPNKSDGTPAIELLPWMISSAEDPEEQVPRWTLMGDDFTTALNDRVDRLLAKFPEGLMLMGLSSAAVQLRQWQRSDARTFRRVAHALARRIICTDLAKRKTGPQTSEIVELTLKSLAIPHPSEDTGDKAAWAHLLADGHTTLTVVAASLIQRFEDSEWIKNTRGS